MSDPLVQIIVLNWNNAPDTIECLASLKQSAYSNAVPLVVDNGSTDGSAAKIAERFPSVRMLKLPENKGFAGGVNAAAKEAVAGGAKYLLLLNSDATVAPDTISNLVSCAENYAKAGIVGAKILRAEDSSRLESEGASVCLCTGRIKQIGFGRADKGGAGRPVERDAVHGAAMLVRAETFKDVGPMSEEFFCYFEEVDYCLRARKKGWRVVLCPAAKVVHKGAATFGGQWSAMRIYYAARNHLLLVARHSAKPLLPIRLWWVRLLYRALLRKAPADRRATLKRWLKKAWSDYYNAKFGRADYKFE
jgi:hypothetical protein